jgi:hypothetical protein
VRIKIDIYVCIMYMNMYSTIFRFNIMGWTSKDETLFASQFPFVEKSNNLDNGMKFNFY